MNVFETPSPLLPVKNLLKEYSLGKRKGSVLKRIADLPISPKKLMIYEQKYSETSSSEDEEKIELEEYEREKIEKDRVENLIKKLEQWLCVDDDNLFTDSSEIEQHMKTDESLQFLMNFIVEPLKYLIDSQVLIPLYIINFKFYVSGQLNMTKQGPEL